MINIDIIRLPEHLNMPRNALSRNMFYYSQFRPKADKAWHTLYGFGIN
ncbi:MAG: hypothetical protein J6U05_04935 [Neisseriaceae bacterium]|nr:hypothetical protein [Neisseriaceae bacterium]